MVILTTVADCDNCVSSLPAGSPLNGTNRDCFHQQLLVTLCPEIPFLFIMSLHKILQSP